MNGHDEYLELLAASIDFGLTEEEVARLNYHLASCPECRRAATELRGQAAAIATTPIAPLGPGSLRTDPAGGPAQAGGPAALGHARRRRAAGDARRRGRLRRGFA